MKVLFITFGDLRFEFVAYNLAKLLTDSCGNEVIIYGRAPFDYPRVVQYEKRVRLVSCRCNRIMRRRIFQIVTMIIDYIKFTLMCFQTAIRFKPDIVLCTSYESVWIGKLVALINNSKFVYYSTEHSERLPLLKVRDIRQLLKWLEKFFLSSEDVIVAVEPWRAEQLRLQTGKRVIVVRNTPLLESDKYFPLQLKRPKTLPIKFVYAGNISNSSGIIEFIKALIFFYKDQVTFDIYGRVDKNVEESFWQEIQKAVAKGISINYHGIVDYKLLNRELKKYDVGVCLYKGSHMNEVYCAPSKLFEYCKAALALFVNKLPGIYNALCESEFVFYVEEVSQEGIAKGIKRVIQRHKNLDELKSQAFDIHIRKFNYNLEVNKLFNEIKNRGWL